MTEIYGNKYTADELYAFVGRMEQVAGIERLVLEEGRAKGVRCARIHTGSGLDMTVTLDRAMDIPLAMYNGAPLNWLSQAGIVAPEFYEAAKKGWDRSFSGGLVQTCGLRCAGHDSVAGGEEFGLHGRISAAPAENVNVTTRWRGDEYVMEITGTMVEAHAYAENMILRRTITTKAGAKTFLLRDQVTNEGAHSTPHLIMYHVNPGFPVVTQGSQVLWSIEKVEETTEEEFLKFTTPPKEAYGGGYFYHRADTAGKARTAVVNPDIGGEPFGFYISYDNKALPVMTTWKQMARHAYLIAIEPANCRVATNKKMLDEGTLPILEPGEKRTYEIEFGVISSEVELEAFRTLLP
ncbi:MAG: DUF4432 family protein [Planctomycetes bacterium]|nr:DUF4432 family protein [Planctomycetota bacterium]